MGPKFPKQKCQPSTFEEKSEPYMCQYVQPFPVILVLILANLDHICALQMMGGLKLCSRSKVQILGRGTLCYRGLSSLRGKLSAASCNVARSDVDTANVPDSFSAPPNNLSRKFLLSRVTCTHESKKERLTGSFKYIMYLKLSSL